MQEHEMNMDEELRSVFDNFDDLYGEIKSKSLEEQIASGKNKIYELRKDLQENGDRYSSEEYEMISDFIDFVEVNVEDLQAKLKFEDCAKERKEQLQDVYINGVRLPKTGYNGAPEVTQELFDKIVQNGTKDLSFDGCYFSEVTINGLFENVCFDNCYMYNCKVENAEFYNSNFQNASIYEVDFQNVTFSEVNFSNASINYSRWKETKFKEADFINCTWKHISTVKNTVSFENCDFLLMDMNSVYIKGSHVIGKMKNIDSINVTMGGATSEEVENHRKNIMETLNSNKVITETKDNKLIEIKNQGEHQKDQINKYTVSKEKRKKHKKVKCL